jgi:hypothetical protein
MLERVNAPFFQKYFPNPISNLPRIVYYLAIDSFFHSPTTPGCPVLVPALFAGTGRGTLTFDSRPDYETIDSPEEPF